MNTRTVRTLAAALSLTAMLAISGCSGESEPKMVVKGAFMPQPVNDKMAGAFMVIDNPSENPDKLISATSPLSDDLQIHETKDQKMQQVQSMDVPADGELRLERGGNHIMFMGLKSTPKVGDKVAVELRFEKAGSVKVELDVKERTYNAQAPTSTADHGH
ncbi:MULTISPECIES: copper chaperone PCu(A)C [unclassified Streptomyces]|uniref:copper chaperone PCu(A)C n=1 Tax=unclassified Streptomyces TaxID=2593676 RepID=UPI000450DBA5|nr:copper chaperone PCu(A)C [Streptomyces sp. PCS3-D2]WKV73128.1 copper chaperone PCu(A)C [Streptomyces sp. PCS3-D2]